MNNTFIQYTLCTICGAIIGVAATMGYWSARWENARGEEDDG